MKFAIFSKDCGDQAINLEKSFDPRKTRKARKYLKRYQIVVIHLKVNSYVMQLTDLFRVFRAFRGQ